MFGHLSGEAREFKTRQRWMPGRVHFMRDDLPFGRVAEMTRQTHLRASRRRSNARETELLVLVLLRQKSPRLLLSVRHEPAGDNFVVRASVARRRMTALATDSL